MLLLIGITAEGSQKVPPELAAELSAFPFPDRVKKLRITRANKNFKLVVSR